MNLEQKVGQLFVPTIWGKGANEAHPMNKERYGVDTPAQVIQRYQVGGAIYFNNTGTDNIDNPKQLAEFSNGLQKAALDSAPHVPLVVAIDQEGGRVTRMESPATEFPDAMAIGAGRDAENAKKAATIMGHELRAVGVNQNFAPVGDVNSNFLNPVIGPRSFSGKPDLAAQMVAAQVGGYQDSGKPTDTVSSSVKHFPGHGDASQDSHHVLPVIDRPADQWRAIDLPPFKAAVDAGIDSVMTAHIRVPSLDPSVYPATMSKPILTGLLRDELKFDGVVVTDSLSMGAVQENFPDAEVPVLAILAGADQMLMPPNLDVAKTAVLQAIQSGRLTEQRIDESVTRILKLKAKRGINKRPFVDVNQVDKVVGTPDNLKSAQAITDRGVTAIRNEGGVLPAKDAQKITVTGWGDTTTAEVAKRITAHGRTASALPTGTDPTDEQIARAVAAAKESDLTVVLTNDLNAKPRQRVLVDQLLATGKKVVAVAAVGPYDAGFTAAPAWLATYGYRPVVLETLTKVLLGEVSPQGKLPVDIPDAGQPGTVKYPFDHGLSW
ncbi:glycoside hydrolase family 3 protein [Herbihabitans rhizosphaerae]|nr:glycoside hydrolase family 3 protein [Herbihabitans rhizosphaerae]